MAFAVLFTHSIIPHHHHEEEKIAQHSGTNDNDDDSNDFDGNPLSQAFGSFRHDGAGTVVYESALSTFHCSHSCVDREAVLVTQYFIRQLFKPPIIQREHSSFAFTPSAYSASSLLEVPRWHRH